MSNKQDSKGAGVGYIAGAILLFLALLPSGVIAIIPCFLLRKTSNERVKVALVTAGISAVVT